MSYSGYESGYRYRRYKKPAAVRAKKYIILGVILAVLIGLFAWFQRNVTDLLYSLSEATVRSLALSALNDAAAEALQWNGIDYDTLVTIERDAEGEITSIETDARQLNLLARQTVALAATKLNAACAQGVQVPAGALTGIELLAGFGPHVTFEVLPVGTARCEFQSAFTSAGINQTRHAVQMEVTATVSILFPSKEMEVSADVPILVCENIIVGDVPSIYLDGRQPLSGGRTLMCTWQTELV